MSSPETQPLPPEPPRLRRLRLLVTVLTATMIIGLIIIIGSIVITLTGNKPKPTIALPSQLEIPQDERMEALTAGNGWVGAVTTKSDGSQTFHIFDAQSGKLRQSLKIIAQSD